MTMMRRTFLLLLGLLPWPLLAAERPDILVLLADDLGWRDLAWSGHPDVRTPHLDRLRRAGVAFTQAHAAAPICSASRAALLTGLSPARLRYEFVPKFAPGRQPDTFPLRTPDYPTELPSDVPSVARALARSGYETAFVGKWHLARHQGRYLGWRDGHGPREFGFSHAVDTFGAHPYGYPKGASPAAIPGETFPPDALTDAAVEFLRRPRQAPFLLWVSFYQVHDPFHSRLADRVAYHRSRLPAGSANARAHFAAMVETLDHEVGRILQALEASGRAGNTLVVFLSDNGGHPAVSANGPLRGGKWSLYQGGLRVPLVVRWPGRVPAGGSVTEPVVGMDLAATLLEAAGLSPAAAADGRSLLPALAGRPTGPARDLLWHFPYYQPETGFDRADPVIGTDTFRVPQVRPHAALRSGDLKLILPFEDSRAELYDLAVDPGETHDLAAARPADTARLRGLLERSLAEQGARLPSRR